MGSLKSEQRQKVESDQERGQEIAEVGETKVEEAEISSEAMSQIEAIDDDDKAALDAAHSEAEGIARMVAESEIRAPGQEVGESLTETAEESNEYAETEYKDAETASEMTGDYGDTGSNLASSLEQSGEEFQEISDEAVETNEELQAELEQLASSVEGQW